MRDILDTARLSACAALICVVIVGALGAGETVRFIAAGFGALTYLMLKDQFHDR